MLSQARAGQAIPDAAQFKFLQMTNSPSNFLDGSITVLSPNSMASQPKQQSLDQQFVGMDAVDGVHNLSPVSSQHVTALELVLILSSTTKFTS